ncbi:MAG: type II toxin-antitoxin system HicA family toxin [Coriobacteriales bacterium]|nr:type II toxin-antitoxin system HicA family toxin [Coriobacteriales bacterium]
MVHKDKRLEHLKANPKAVSFEELVATLKAFGFEVKNYSGGSHFSVSHPRYPVFVLREPNSIPRHRPHVLPVYARRAIKWIERVRELEEGKQNDV